MLIYICKKLFSLSSISGLERDTVMCFRRICYVYISVSSLLVMANVIVHFEGIVQYTLIEEMVNSTYNWAKHSFHEIIVPLKQ